MGLQLLQLALHNFHCSHRRAACHFLVSSFARGTPVYSFLWTQMRLGEWLYYTRGTGTPGLGETSPLMQECRRILGKSHCEWRGKTVGRWKSPVYSKLACEARPKSSTEQRKLCLMGHFSSNYPRGEESTITGAGACCLAHILLITLQPHLVAHWHSEKLDSVAPNEVTK